MEPPTAKMRVQSYTSYRTTKEPAVTYWVCFDNISSEDDLNRLPEDESFVEHVLIAMFLVHPVIADFDAESYVRDSRDIIHSSDVDGSRGGGCRR